MPKKLTNPLLSVVMPAFNEENSIGEAIKAVQNSGYKPLELIVVDDGSTDKTLKIIKSMGKKVTKLVIHQKNMGKGAAIRSGISHAKGKIIVFQDADLEYDPSEYQLLVEPIINHGADVVYGSRFMGGNPHRIVYFWHYFANQVITFISNVFTNLNLTDIETGYKAFTKAAISKINISENSFAMEPEITAQIARHRMKIYEVGISYHGRTYQEGKKIDWQDGLKAIYVIFREGIKTWLSASRAK